MKDLANERDAVRRKLEEFNFEPVNAENLMPDGKGSWERIQDEIATSDVLVLILGETYGWVPTSGPHAGSGKSVTELEFLEAKRHSLPVLPFVKQIEGSAVGPDAAQRELFRKRVEDWDEGHFRAQFVLAHDLAAKVARSLVELLGSHYLDQVRGHPARAATPSPPALRGLPDELAEAVASRSAVALVGAGVSLAAGLPSAPLFIEAMRKRIEEVDPGYRPTASGSLFFAVATDLEALLGVEELQRLVRDLVSPTFLTGTTESHRATLELFDLVLTTNYDELLERAMDTERTHAVVADDATMVDLSATPAIVKLHGSIGRPASLILTEAQLAGLSTSTPKLRDEVAEQLQSRPLVAVGSSLRDPGLVALFEKSRAGLRGWAVADHLPLAARQRLKRWHLEPVEADAHDFFVALQATA